MLGWVYEHVPSNIHTKIWQRKLLVIRKLKLQFYGGFPVSSMIPEVAELASLVLIGPHCCL